ncbi:MAG: response regulator [Balneolaceae bacterium]|nr:response regulator [Balneolaceae bacterium]
MNSLHNLLVEDNEGDILLTAEAVRSDLILPNINLPKVNGHEVLISVKQNPDLNEISSVILPTSSDVRDLKKPYRNHSNCYIVKPSDIQSFTNVIESIENFWIKIAELPNNADKLR